MVTATATMKHRRCSAVICRSGLTCQQDKSKDTVERVVPLIWVGVGPLQKETEEMVSAAAPDAWWTVLLDSPELREGVVISEKLKKLAIALLFEHITKRNENVWH